MNIEAADSRDESADEGNSEDPGLVSEEGTSSFVADEFEVPSTAI